MMKKLVSLMLVAAMALTVVACGAKKEEAPATAETTDATVLVMATNAEFPPYEYYEGQDIVGIDAEIAAAIAEKLGCELKIEDMAFDSIIAAVTSGKADFGLAAMTVTEDRLESVNFSDTYATATQVVIVAEDFSNTFLDLLRYIVKGLFLTVFFCFVLKIVLMCSIQ